ncbi:iron-binding protein FbpA [Pseudoalteromonas porphyrae]|uniref:Iron-binding protein FbpA n=1 Tax=Pseudoalteromonas porphyrae TaxID=187330 RepID=A0A0N0M222_9GAMM|nr:MULTISPECIES: extracellular solute-binding protein [Pseudoalteromonas]KPH65279.1 iron-binding protein FbpA [Pseudoalteromonas porphyrae]KPH92814.1 iron-binding protein FbpA [Pseudoalteromonas porphyrae]NMR27266.1 extracellular solute-binding protein [Pseudoalteromonas sp. NEC-BIFX-2020_015]
MIKSKLYLLFLFSVLSADFTFANQSEINIYSFRKQELIAPLLNDFEQTTKIKVNLVNGKSQELLRRLNNDGAQSLADIVLSADLAQLHNHRHLLQPFNDFAQLINVPTQLRDTNNLWLSVSIRGRALFTSDTTHVPTPIYYGDLQQPQYQETFCVRDWQHSYNQTLFAGLLASNNNQDSAWIQHANKLLVKRPSGSDRDQLRSLAQGKCQFAFANHYYLAMLQNSQNKRDRDMASKLSINWLKNQQGLTPISTTTVAIAKYAPNADNANRFIEYLISDSAQKMYASLLAEYPVTSVIKNSEFKPALEGVKRSIGLLDQAKAISP